MQPTFIVSSNIEAAAYQYGSMFIRFKSGVSYRYDKVPHAVFIGLCEAESAGQYFHRKIRGVFEFQKLAYDPFTSTKEAA